jgi:tRNA A37 threonylcarbamoyladenosine modification protein TsaB
MYKILIDSTERFQKKVELILVENKKEKILDLEEGNIDIVSAIQTLLNKNDLKPEDIEEYVSHPGPGSFTGLKIGATIANVFNWALGKKEITELSYPDYGREPNITLKSDEKDPEKK